VDVRESALSVYILVFRPCSAVHLPPVGDFHGLPTLESCVRGHITLVWFSDPSWISFKYLVLDLLGSWDLFIQFINCDYHVN